MEDVWPSLFFGSERIEGVRKKLGVAGWARDMQRGMVAEAEVLLGSPPSLPPGKPGWRHDYYSPRSAEHLEFDPGSRVFKDPSDGSRVKGHEQESAWILLMHERTYRLMRSVGLLYGLTGDERYSDWVAQGMRRAVEFFRTAPRNESKHGALYFSPLYDAQVILLASNAYDLTAESSSYGPGDREEILGTIFEDGSRSLLSHHGSAKTHNITAYVSAAIGATGSVLGDGDLVDLSLSEDPRGLFGLLSNGLRRDGSGRSDGFWFEGTTFYHFYAMFPLFYLYELARRLGFPGDLDGIRRDLSDMARAPLVLSDQDLRLPWFGDLGSERMTGLPLFEHVYEYAASRLDPSFSRVIPECILRGAGRGLPALVFGPPILPGTPGRIARGHLPLTGVAILRGEDRGTPYYVAMRAGNHGAGHDHFDRLGMVIHAGGSNLAPDIGTAGYSLRSFKEYCVSTLAHNTLMVDEVNQGRVGSSSLRCSGSRAIGRASDAYPGVALERRLELDPPRIWVEDTVICESGHSLAWIFHAQGGVKLIGAGSPSESTLPPMPGDGPFGFLDITGTLLAEDFVRASWQVSDDITLELTARWEGSCECNIGTSPSNPMTNRLGTLIIRKIGRTLAIQSEFRVSIG